MISRFLPVLLPIFLCCVLSGCDQSSGIPAEGKMTFGSLEINELRSFFYEKTGVELPAPPDRETTMFKYFNDGGKQRGFTNIILMTSPSAASAILEQARGTFKKRHETQGGIHFEYRNYIVRDYGGMSIPEEAPVLYWDDGTPDGEQLRLEIDPDSGTLRLASSTGVIRDELARKAALEQGGKK